MAFFYLDFSFLEYDKAFDYIAEHMQDIIGLLFKYISLLQQSGICKWIFDEVYTLCILVYELLVHDTFFCILSNMKCCIFTVWITGAYSY